LIVKEKVYGAETLVDVVVMAEWSQVQEEVMV
jgi:hypothetical protein